ncbi:MAG: hypothetical protein HC892_00405 [Saprospiraceae bacterium]|nr:hypothetical protein [Saprospiraceae bacterium]
MTGNPRPYCPILRYKYPDELDHHHERLLAMIINDHVKSKYDSWIGRLQLLLHHAGYTQPHTENIAEFIWENYGDFISERTNNMIQMQEYDQEIGNIFDLANNDVDNIKSVFIVSSDVLNNVAWVEQIYPHMDEDEYDPITRIDIEKILDRPWEDGEKQRVVSVRLRNFIGGWTGFVFENPNAETPDEYAEVGDDNA